MGNASRTNSDLVRFQPCAFFKFVDYARWKRLRKNDTLTNDSVTIWSTNEQEGLSDSEWLIPEYSSYEIEKKVCPFHAN